MKRAHIAADTTGLHMQVCYADRTGLGMLHHIVNVRSTRTDVKRQLNLDGSWTVTK